MPKYFPAFVLVLELLYAVNIGRHDDGYGGRVITPLR